MKVLIYWVFFYFSCGFGAFRSWELAGNVVESIKRGMVQL
jgi:hypothetical protein